MTQTNTPSRPDRSGISGKYVLLFSALILLLVVPVATWITLRSVERSKAAVDQPLDFAQRDQWRVLPVEWTDLGNRNFMNPFSTELRDTDFVLSSEQMTEDLRFADRVRGAAPPQDLLEPGADDPFDITGFYGTYLVGHWLGRQMDDAAARKEAGYRQAPAALVLRFVDPDGQPVQGLAISPLTVRFAQVKDGELDDRLELVYPGHVTDTRGRIFLPVYDAPLRVDFPALEGVTFDADWPAGMWMTWPGQVGGPPAVMVRR